jgi:hypothetical protein
MCIHRQGERLHLYGFSFQQGRPHEYDDLKTDPLASPSIGGIRFGHETDPLRSASLNLSLTTHGNFSVESLSEMADTLLARFSLSALVRVVIDGAGSFQAERNSGQILWPSAVLVTFNSYVWMHLGTILLREGGEAMSMLCGGDCRLLGRPASHQDP